MARLRISLPEKFPFETELDVRVTDINYGGHLGNDALVGLLHEARLRWLDQLGQSELDFYGRGLIMLDLMVQYKQQGFRSDRLTVAIAPEMDGPRFQLYYLVKNSKDGREVARARTGIVCFDYEAQEALPVPEEFRGEMG